MMKIQSFEIYAESVFSLTNFITTCDLELLKEIDYLKCLDSLIALLERHETILTLKCGKTLVLDVIDSVEILIQNFDIFTENLHFSLIEILIKIGENKNEEISKAANKITHNFFNK